MPVDSKVVIRPRSALGLKYVELDTGRSKKVFADGATMPASQASVPVDIDEVYNMFDAPTRRASQGNLQGFGDALAGRGADLNQTIQVAPAALRPPRLGHGQPVRAAHRAALLLQGARGRRAHRRAGLEDQRAPLHDDGQHLRRDLARPAGAQVDDLQEPADAARRHRVAAACSARSSSTPPRSRATSTPRRPSCAARCRRSTRRCASAPPCSGARSTLNDNLQGALGALEDLVKAPTTLGSLRGLTATVGTLQPQLRYLGPYVTVCNSWNIFWTFAAEHLSAPDDTGSSQRALLNMATQAPGTDGIGSSGANEFAHGKGALPGRADQYVHNNVYAPAIDEKGNADCGAGQTGYIQAYNPLRDKSVKGDPYQGAVTERFPISGRLGPTYAQFDKDGKGHGLNPDHVPAGETFTDRPGGHGVDIARPQP